MGSFGPQLKREQAAMFAQVGCTKHPYRIKLKCGHMTNIYDAKASVCYECRLKERKSPDRAEVQRELGYLEAIR